MKLHNPLTRLEYAPLSLIIAICIAIISTFALNTWLCIVLGPVVLLIYPIMAFGRIIYYIFYGK